MLNVRNLKKLTQVSSFRRLAIASWDDPRDPTIYGSLDVDATNALAYLSRKSEESGEKITMTHLVGRCLAQCYREYPDANTMIRGANFYRRDSVDIFYQVAITSDDPSVPDDLSGAVVRRADTKSVVDICRELRERSKRIRRNEDKEVSKVKSNLEWIPPVMLKAALRAVDKVSYNLNISLPGMPRDPFGSAMVTSMGMFGIARAWAPLFPPSHCAMIVMAGAVERRPWVTHVNGEETLEIRPVMTLTVSFDHRVMDGVLGAKLTRRIDALMNNPDELDALDAMQG